MSGVQRKLVAWRDDLLEGDGVKGRVLLAWFLGSGMGWAEPSFALVDETTLEISWAGQCDKQYGLFRSSDLAEWVLVGSRMLGREGTLSVERGLGDAGEMFFRVEEYSEFVLDLERLKFGTAGNRWSYAVTKDSGLGLGVETFTWDSEIAGRTTFHEQEVVEWLFNQDGNWSHSIYLLDDFSMGLFEVGGETADQGSQTNTPGIPSLLANFTPGVAIPVTYTATTLLGASPTDEELTITVEKEPLTVGAGTFANLIKARRVYSGSLGGFPVGGTTTEWFALEVGLVKHVGEVNVLGRTASTTFELSSYEVE